MPKQVFSLLLLSFFVIISCRSNQPVLEEVSSEDSKAASTEKKDVWGWDYEGPRGPKNWSQLNKQYDMCSSGKNQSPINLVWHKPTTPSPLKVNYKEGNGSLINTGYTYRLEMTPQSSISFSGTEYLLEKVEFRTPSEHKLSGNSLPVELQFYHRSSNGLKQAIISLFVISGKGSAWFDKIWDVAEKLPKFKSSPSFRFNPDQLIPPRQTFYHYEGSLTHPPCLEGVQWFVFNTPLQLSQEQILKLRSMYNNNNRPIQSTGDRKIINY